MMKLKSRTIMVVALAGLFAITSLITVQSQAQADESRVIRINSDPTMQSVRLEPREMWVRPGTTIIWNNWVNAEISIIFKEGAKCDAATESAMGFALDSKSGCMVTSQVIPMGGTASMMFKSAGTYKYDIEMKGRTVKGMKGQGSITVRPPTPDHQ
jgi:plastocyanin